MTRKTRQVDRRQQFDFFADAESHGLLPQDFFAFTLAGLESGQSGLADAERDILITEALLRYVYHHMSETEAMRSSLRRSLSQRGLLVVIEKLERGGHGISLDDMIDEMTADGVRLISRHPRWGGHQGHHAAVFAPSSLGTD